MTRYIIFRLAFGFPTLNYRHDDSKEQMLVNLRFIHIFLA